MDVRIFPNRVFFGVLWITVLNLCSSESVLKVRDHRRCGCHDLGTEKSKHGSFQMPAQDTKRADSEGGEHGPNAQEELPAVRATPEIDRESAAEAEDHRAEEVPEAAGAAGGPAAAGRECTSSSTTSRKGATSTSWTWAGTLCISSCT